MKSSTVVVFSLAIVSAAAAGYFARPEIDSSSENPEQVLSPVEASPITPSTQPTTTDSTTTPPPIAVTSDSADTTDGVVLAARLDRSLYMRTTHEAALQADIRFTDTDDLPRLPVALTVVVDTSGSMSGLPIHNARSAAQELIGSLREGDLLTLVAYDSSARVLLERVPVSADRAALLGAVEELRAMGSTCISCALETVDSVSSRIPSTYAHRTVLLSDGQATAGNTSSPALVEMARQIHADSTVVTAVGVGTDYDAELMQSIADAGVGNYYFVSGPNALDDVLGREISALHETVARQAWLEVTTPSGWAPVASAVPGLQSIPGRTFLDLGALTRTQRTVLIPFTTPAFEESGAVSLTLHTGDPREAMAVAQAEFGLAETIADSNHSRNVGVMEQWELLRSAQLVELAMQNLAQGNSGQAQVIMRQNRERLQRASVDFGSAALRDEQELVMGAETVLAAPVAPAASRAMELQNSARRRERAAGNSPAAEAYHEAIVF